MGTVNHTYDGEHGVMYNSGITVLSTCNLTLYVNHLIQFQKTHCKAGSYLQGAYDQVDILKITKEIMKETHAPQSTTVARTVRSVSWRSKGKAMAVGIAKGFTVTWSKK